MSVLICLDPGHGGSDSGATGFGLREADVCLNIAQRVKKLLDNYEGVRVVLTRTTDKFVELRDRSSYANKMGADFLLSIHSNAASPDAHGFELYVYTSPSQASIMYQKVIHDTIIEFLKKYNIRDRGKKRANLHMCRETRMPAVLLENLFITNATENKLLKDSSFRQGLAGAITQGLAKSFGLKRKETTPPLPFYDLAINDEDVARVSARNPDELAAAVKRFVLRKIDKIILEKRK
jgi:N-acetylmuramoyl-L-alanine amidase